MLVHEINLNPVHGFHKFPKQEIELVKGYGVRGDAHFGKIVKHRSRVAKNPGAPNLRQVHLISMELIEKLVLEGFEIEPGTMGENITTSGVNLLNLSRGTKLQIGDSAVIELTGLRNPCVQLDAYQSGLMKAVLEQDENGNLIRKAGVMAIVDKGGFVRKGDEIRIIHNPGIVQKLLPV